jgi:hypothetical protein
MNRQLYVAIVCLHFSLTCAMPVGLARGEATGESAPATANKPIVL